MTRSNASEGSATQDTPRADDPPFVAAPPDATTSTDNGNRERRSRRSASARDLVDVDHPVNGTEGSDGGAPTTVPPRPSREDRRTARGERRQRPRAPRTEQAAAPVSPTSAPDNETAGDPALVPEAATAAAEALVINLSGKKPNRGARTLKRARRKQQDAAAALAGADDNPALGALNRHLNMMMQQLGRPHRGRTRRAPPTTRGPARDPRRGDRGNDDRRIV
jgi:hypothetical protein